MQRDFVKAAQYMGIPPRRIVWRHLVPNIGSLLVLAATRGVTGAILAEVAFSFIGIGIKVPDVSLGVLIGQATSQVSTFPWMFWAPLTVMFLLTGSLAMMNDGLRDAFDPSSSSIGRAKKKEDPQRLANEHPTPPRHHRRASPRRGLHAPTGAVLSVRDFNVRFNTENGVVHAVRGVDFDLMPGKTLGIVGESGSGKSVTSMAIMGLLPRRREITGSVRLRGKELLGLSDKAMCQLPRQRPRHGVPGPAVVADAVYTVGNQIIEALKVHNPTMSKRPRRRAPSSSWHGGHPQPEGPAQGLPARVLRRHAPARHDRHRDRQRSRVLIADEPTTALDVTIQAQVLEVLHTAQEETGAAVVMITHDLGVVAGMADDIMVMYAGQAGGDRHRRGHLLQPADALHDGPARVRCPARGRRGKIVAGGRSTSMPRTSPSRPPAGSFAPRCPLASEACLDGEPDLRGGGRPAPGTGPRALRERAPCSRRRCPTRFSPSRPWPVSRFDSLPRHETQDCPRNSRDVRKHFPLMKGALIKRGSAR